MAATRRGLKFGASGQTETGSHSSDTFLLENYYLPGALEQAVETFVEHYNHHESLGNLTPADVYFGRANNILSERRKIKEQTLKQRRLLNQRQAA